MKGNEKGFSPLLVVVAMGGVLMAIISSAVAGVTWSSLSHARSQSASVQIGSLNHGRLTSGWFVLAERLQSLAPVTALELTQLMPGVTIQDEGGKVSLPDNIHLLPTVLSRFSVPNAYDRALGLGEFWEIPVVGAPRLRYPALFPGPGSRSYTRFECAEELAAYLEIPGRAGEVRRWFTPCPLQGVNVNTAEEAVLDGVVEWTQKCLNGWTDRAAHATAMTLKMYHDYEIPHVDVDVWPLPGQDSVAISSTFERPRILDTVMPQDLMAIDPSEPYDSLWLIVATAAFRAPFEVSWLTKNNQMPPYRRAYFESGTVSFPPYYGQKSYVPKIMPWMRGQGTADASTIIQGRPYAASELTQSLGLLWYTPEGWFMPHNPTVMGEFAEVPGSGLPPIGLNVGLSAAAFTGWISLQGPGVFRSTSDWFTFSTQSRESGVAVTTSVTIRVFPNEEPRVLAWRSEE